MLNRWYRRHETDSNPLYLHFVYRNSAQFPLIRQIEVKYVRHLKEFGIAIYPPNISAQQKIIECFKPFFTEAEFRNFDCYTGVEISIDTNGIAADSELLV